MLGYFGRAIKALDEDGAHDALPQRKRCRYDTASMRSDGHAIDFGRGNLRIPRECLRRMLLSRLDDSIVHWGKRLKIIDERTDDVQLTFEDGEVITADVVVGADGLRSAVRRYRDERLGPEAVTECASSYVGVRVIIGLSNYRERHELVDGGGFYVVDGESRLFVMPFQTEPRVTMWQLSFNASSPQGSDASPSELIAEAMTRTSHWTISPVKELIEATPDSEVWSTGIHDRWPMTMKLWGKQQSGSLVTVLGDACHPMTMFKGQGANQALADAPRLASWLFDPPGGRKHHHHQQQQQQSKTTVPAMTFSALRT